MNIQRLDDKDRQIFRTGKNKIAFFNNLDLPRNLEKSTRNYGNSSVNTKVSESGAGKSDKVQNQELYFTTRPRTYAKIIEDYSEAIVKRKQINSNKQLYKKLFSKLPINSVISSLTRFERVKHNKANQHSKNSSLALTDNGIKNEKMKKSTNIKETQKREFNTTNSHSIDNINSDEESRELINRLVEARKKQFKSERTKNCLTLTNKLQNNFDMSNEDGDAFNLTKNSVSRLASSTKACHKVNSAIVTGNNSKSLRTVGSKMKTLSTVTSEVKREIKMPKKIEIQNKKGIGSKASVVSLRIAANLQGKPHKTKKFSNYQKIPTRHSSGIITKNNVKISVNDIKRPLRSSKTIEFNSFSHIEKLLQLNKKRVRNKKSLPWWASNNHTINNQQQQTPNKAKCLKDLYSSNPKIQVLASEELSQMDNTGEPNRLLETALAEPYPSVPLEQKPRWRRKLTSLSKVMRHIEEEIEIMKNEVKKENTSAESLICKMKSNADAALKELQGKDITKQMETDEEVDISSTKTIIESKKFSKLEKKGAEDNEMVTDRENPKSEQDKHKENNNEVERSKFAKIDGDSKKLIETTSTKKNTIANLSSQSENNPCIKTEGLTKSGNAYKSNTDISDKIIRAKKDKLNNVNGERMNVNMTSKSGESKRKEDFIDDELKTKRISDTFKPIEKKKDGTLIDYGLKVPTRKPKAKPTEKSSAIPVTIEKNTPKKAIAVPQHQQQLNKRISNEKSDVPFKMNYEFSKKSNFNNIFQTQRELPLSKNSKTKLVNKRLVNQSKKVAIKKNIQKNSMLKTSSDPAFGKSDDGPRSHENNNRKNSLLKSLKCEQMLHATDKNEKIKSPLRSFLDSNWIKLNIYDAESKLRDNLNRTENELTDSLWLNQFHAKNRDITIK